LYSLTTPLVWSGQHYGVLWADGSNLYFSLLNEEARTVIPALTLARDNFPTGLSSAGDERGGFGTTWNSDRIKFIRVIPQ
jgi:hypothetical protein